MTIRAARPADLPAIAALCRAHAAFERSQCRDDLDTALEGFLFAGPPPRHRNAGEDACGPGGETPALREPRGWCAVAEEEQRLVGYATWSREFSTWRASDYVHMDCLFVSEPYRNAGIGARLLRFVTGAAAALGCRIVEWQTPQWNSDAIRFYDRCGATGSPKIRYRIEVTNGK